MRHTRFLPSRILQTEPQKVHIGRRVYDSQRTVDVECIYSWLTVEPLRQHTLKDISRCDVLLRLLHRLQEGSFRGPCFELQLSLGSLLPNNGQCARKALLKPIEPPHRTLVRSLASLARQVGGHHQVDLFLHMVERQHLIEEHQASVGNSELILRG